MRTLIAMLVFLPSLALAFDALAPGTDDASAIPLDDPAIAWTSALRVGTARPWGSDGVGTDWVHAGWARRPIALRVGFARTAAGSVDVTRSSAGVAWRLRRVAFRFTWMRRTTAVEGFASEVAAWPRGAVRLQLDDATVAADVIRRPEDGAHWRVRLSCHVARGPASMWVARSDATFDTGTSWVFAGRLHLMSALGLGLRVDPRGTLWALDLGRQSWRLRVGRVVDGPRAGGSAIALEWRS